MQGEASVIGADVQGLAPGVNRRSSVVFPLIKEGAGLLSAQAVIMKADSIHGDGSGAFASVKQAGLECRKLLQGADAVINPLNDVFHSGKFAQGCHNCLTALRTVPRLREN